MCPFPIDEDEQKIFTNLNSGYEKEKLSIKMETNQIYYLYNCTERDNDGKCSNLVLDKKNLQEEDINIIGSRNRYRI